LHRDFTSGRGATRSKREVEGAIRMDQSVHDKEVKEGTVRKA
jgi:hypothetical protein